MDSPEEDIKPIIPTDDIPNKSLPNTVPGAGKLKVSRYEDVWPEDVHAAFMEAVGLYPPMGKRRLKYYRMSTHENEHLSDANRVKSFGRCQLIQSYILEKTGKNRSRKQVSSHLQRLKKIHKNNPAMRPLFSEDSQFPAEHFSGAQAVTRPSQDTLTNVSFSRRHLKSDFDLTVSPQNTDGGADSSSTHSYPSEASSLDTGLCNAVDLSTAPHDQPLYFFPQDLLSPQKSSTVTLYPADCDYLSELPDPFLLKDATHGGLRAGSAFNASAWSVSMRRLGSKQGRQLDFGTTTHFSRAIHSLGFQPTNQWISHSGGSTDNISCNSPLLSAEQVSHTPFYPMILPDKQRLDSGLASDWMWPQNPDVSLNHQEDPYGELCLRYPPATYPYNPNPAYIRATSPEPYSFPVESAAPRLPIGLSYSYTVTSPTAVSDNIPKEGALDLAPENLASPLVIKPTPIYPTSYIHSDRDRHMVA